MPLPCKIAVEPALTGEHLFPNYYLYLLVSSTEIILEKQEETLRKSRIWLGGIGRDLEFEKNRKLHTAGTCEWILKSDLFKSWIAGEVDILLINGIPGKFT